MKKMKKKNPSKRANKAGSMADGLAHLLADTYILYVKTQNFHWNVTGAFFFSFHKMFEEQYDQLADAVDTIAERMRALKVIAPASLGEFLALTSLEEADGNHTADEMIGELLHDHEKLAQNITTLFGVAQYAGDEVTLDMLIQRKTEHEKTAWMLRSTLA